MRPKYKIVLEVTDDSAEPFMDGKEIEEHIRFALKAVYLTVTKIEVSQNSPECQCIYDWTDGTAICQQCLRPRRNMEAKWTKILNTAS